MLDESTEQASGVSNQRQGELGRRAESTEELLAKKDVVADMKKAGFKNWSSLIPVRIFMEKLERDANSYLTAAPSKFTFIRKNKSYIMEDEDAWDINLMPPMIL